MARTSKKLVKEYQPLAPDSEALWALIAVVAMAILLEVYQRI